MSSTAPFHLAADSHIIRFTQVPLWLALSPNKIKRCKILPPSWFTERTLPRFVADEKENDNELLNIPFFFFEVSENFSTFMCTPIDEFFHLAPMPLSYTIHWGTIRVSDSFTPPSSRQRRSGRPCEASKIRRGSVKHSRQQNAPMDARSRP